MVSLLSQVMNPLSIYLIFVHEIDGEWEREEKGVGGNRWMDGKMDGERERRVRPREEKKSKGCFCRFAFFFVGYGWRGEVFFFFFFEIRGHKTRRWGLSCFACTI